VAAASFRTGLYGSSTVRRTALQTGAVQAKTALSRSYFGEGLSRLGDKLYQLTYKGNLGFVYNLSDLKQVGGPV
jgi:glutamine cyclotransferase